MRVFVVLLLTACTDPDGEPAPEDTACEPITRWRDADGDGFGDGDGPVEGCQAPPGFVEAAGDCDDTDADVFPGALEVCDEQDTNCDGTGDADVAWWFTDADGDGFGDLTTGIETCAPSAGLLADGTDCDDADATVFPGAEERCDDVDQDCDGATDDGTVETWHADVDGDGYGDPGAAEATCAPAEGWVLDATDCAPEDATVHPGAEEVCGDGVDADCRGGDASCALEGGHSLDEAIKLTSSGLGYQSGWQVRTGDVTDDGIDDLVVSTLYADFNQGGAYVVPGPIVGDVALDADTIHLSGSLRAYGAGRSIAVGDLDGDGIGDVAVAAPYEADDNGLYVVTGPVTADVELETDADIVLRGPYDAFASHGADVADVNGDGFDDAIVGAYGVDRYRIGGVVYVAYGPFEPGEHDLATMADLTLAGEAEDAFTGRWVRGGGDLNGDGVGDMLLAAPFGAFNGPYTGAVYIVYGPGDPDSDLADADGRILGVTPNSYAGVEIGMGGDLNGDGLDDVGAQTFLGSGGPSTGAGTAHVVFGPAEGEREVSDADILVEGTHALQYAGSSFALGDLDGDGSAELVLGAYGDNTAATEAGAVYFFYAPGAGSYEITDADAWFLGEDSGDQAGSSLTTGDLDADGQDQLVVGAPSESSGARDGGAVYVLD